MKHDDNHFSCEICIDAPMKLIKKASVKEDEKRHMHYRERWYKCEICGFEKKVNGSGYYQDVVAPYNAINELNKRLKDINNET